MNKPRILLLIGAFLPGYKAGGPIPSIANMVTRLSEKFDFYILTADRDLGDHSPYENIARDRWIDAYGAKVFYASPSSLSYRGIQETINQVPHDILYLNSCFATRFSILPLVLRRLRQIKNVPTLIAPRGEFSVGALSLNLPKKQSYLYLGRKTGILSNLHWHASTAHEEYDIQRVMGSTARSVHIASDLSAALPKSLPHHSSRTANDALRVVFVSRISPIKNLDYALKVIGNISFPLDFTIVGPDEDLEYTKKCRSIANQMPEHINVRWSSALPPNQIPDIMAAHDIFFFPSRGENFGHVIAESLGAGTPVLLSNTTPWRGLKELGVGYDLPLDRPDQFAAALKETWEMPSNVALQKRERAAEYARMRQDSSKDVEANQKMFWSVLGNT